MKTAVVTGITSDIAQAITSLLVKAEWNVVGVSRDDADLSDAKAVAKLGDSIKEEHEQIDALVHVAGVWHDDTEVFAHKDLEDFDWTTISNTMNVGLTSFMILAAKLLPIVTKDGTIVGITGTFGTGASGWLPYYTSKRGLEDFIIGLAQDYPYGPRVFGVSPADTATKPYVQFFPEDAETAQDPLVVAKVVVGLLMGESLPASGSVLRVGQGKVSDGYHV